MSWPGADRSSARPFASPTPTCWAGSPRSTASAVSNRRRWPGGSSARPRRRAPSARSAGARRLGLPLGADDDALTARWSATRCCSTAARCWRTCPPSCFERLRADPAMGRYCARDLHGVHRAVAALGHATRRPRRSTATASPSSRAPHRLGRVGRALARDLDAGPEGPRQLSASSLAKVGRWLAAEHPEITEPAPVDPADLRGLGRGRRPHGRRRLLQWRAGLRGPARQAADRREPRPATSRRPAPFFRDCQEWEWIPRRFDPARALAHPAQHRAPCSGRTPA